MIGGAPPISRSTFVGSRAGERRSFLEFAEWRGGPFGLAQASVDGLIPGRPRWPIVRTAVEPSATPTTHAARYGAAMAKEMRFVQVSSHVVGPFDSQVAAEKFKQDNGGDLIDPILDGGGGTRITSVQQFEDVGDRRCFTVVRVGDGWFVSPQPPLPATTTALADGWDGVQFHRDSLNAVDWFPNTSDFDAFVEEFGPPPI